MMAGRELENRLATLGWGAFLLWIGVAWLANVSWGVTLLGVGLITLGGEAARSHWVSRVSNFWLAIGSLFALSGIWIISDARLAFVPILCVVAGLVLLASLLQRRRHPPS